MAGKITNYFRVHSAKQFHEQFGEASPSNLYFFIARPYPWSNELLPPDSDDTTELTNYDIWNDMMALKKISQSDVSFGVDRNDWTTGTVYSQYTSDSEFFEDNDFHVVTEDYNVYKCLYNNNGAASTTKPTGTDTTPITTADGYIWKYMFTISAADALKFSTVRMIPVKTLTSDDGTIQWDVQQAAISGTINSILVDTGGSSYKENSGTLSAGGTTTATLAVGANTTNDVYNGSTIYITAGTGSGQLRSIVNYVGGTRVITVNNAFSPATDGTSQYVVSPKVTITGTGTGAKAYSRVTAGSISKVNVINTGNSYTRATAAITSNAGSGATISPQISPFGGHGKDPVNELFAHNVIMNVKMTGSESNTFIIGNEFRTVGIIADPVERVANTAADDSTYRQTVRITIDNPVSTFSADEVINGGTSGANAHVIEYFTNTIIVVTGGNGINFSNTETITGVTSGATGVIDGITLPDLQKYQGKLLYVENRSPISRSAEQQEDIKLIVRF